MRVLLDDERLQIRLSLWQKVLGLLRDITLARSQIGEIEVLDDGIPVTMRAGIKIGLRLPWLYYVARTLSLDEVFVVRRGVPALALALSGGRLKRVVVSTPDAAELAARLRGPAAP